MNDIGQLVMSNDMISDEFLLRQYVKTIGSYGQTLTVGNVQCHVYDDGGGSPYKRGSHLGFQSYDNLNSIVYVTSLVDYCQEGPKDNPKVCKISATFGVTSGLTVMNLE